MAKPRERAVIFADWEVRAALAGRKTQRRDPVDTQPVLAEQFPLGRVGDVLWVRETWQPLWENPDAHHDEIDWTTGKGLRISYPATDGVVEWYDEDVGPRTACRSSTQMPKWASRLRFKIVGVRVERLRDMSEDDAVAEGCEADTTGGTMIADFNAGTAMAAYRGRWDSRHGQLYPWASNPWVWVRELQRVEK